MSNSLQHPQQDSFIASGVQLRGCTAIGASTEGVRLGTICCHLVRNHMLSLRTTYGFVVNSHAPWGEAWWPTINPKADLTI
jgi:hypothetical protein